MDTTLIQQLVVSLPNLGVALFMLWHFIQRDEKKDSHFQENLNRFVELQKESNSIHSKTSEVLNTVVIKLNEIHTEVRFTHPK